MGSEHEIPRPFEDIEEDPYGDKKDQNEAHAMNLIIPLAIVAGICVTLILAILWNRFCRRRQNQEIRGRSHSCHCTNHSPYFPPYITRPLPNPIGYRENPAYFPDETEQMQPRPLHLHSMNETERQLDMEQTCVLQTLERQRTAVDVVRPQEEHEHAIQRAHHTEHVRNDLQQLPIPQESRGSQDCWNGPLVPLLEASERSSMKTVCDKLVVSIARKVTHRGDYLPLDNMGIGLSVPPGAVKEGEEKMITLVLNWDLNDNPEMDENESLVSPVVYVGPHGLRLEKPCTLRYKHCAYDRRHIRVMRSETELVEKKEWQTMCDQEDDTGMCSMTADEVQLQINSFTLFTCVQSPNSRLRMGKWLQLAVFSYPLKSSIHHHQVRVYFLNKTPCALQWAIQNEANFDGKLMCPEKAFLFYGNSEDIRINLRYLSDKWEKVDDDDYDRVQYLHIWHGKCPHVSMCFRKKDSVIPNKELNFSLYVYQDTIDNEGEKIVVHATESTEEAPGSNDLSCHKHNEDHSTVIVNFPLVRPDTHSKVEIKRSKTESESSVSVLAAPENCHCDLQNMADFRSSLPYSCKLELRKRLDPENPMGNNWKAFIEKIGHGNCIEYIQSLRESPTDLCLAQAERQGMSIDDIKNVFRDIGRMDAAIIIEKFNKEQSDTPAENVPVQNSLSRATDQMYPNSYDERHSGSYHQHENFQLYRTSQLLSNTNEQLQQDGKILNVPRAMNNRDAAYHGKSVASRVPAEVEDFLY